MAGEVAGEAVTLPGEGAQAPADFRSSKAG